MNARCSICLDNLTDDKCPMTTLCGHLYCLDDATYNFAQPNATCAICRRPHTLDMLVRLYPNYDEQDSVEASDSSSAQERYAEAVRVGQSVLSACNRVLEEADLLLDTVPVLTAITKTEELASHLLEDETPAVRNLWRSIVNLLDQLRTTLDEINTNPELTKLRDRLSATHGILTSRLHAARSRQETERQRARRKLSHQRAQFEARTQALQAEIQDAIALLRQEHESVEQSNARAEELKAEAKKWRKDSERYKRKYNALKEKYQEIRQTINEAFFPNPDDSRIIEADNTAGDLDIEGLPEIMES